MSGMPEPGSLDIRVHAEADSGDHEEILSNLRQFNRSKAGHSNHRPLIVTIRDPQGELLGGLSGFTIWNWLHVDLLWLREDMRGKDLGTRILSAAEREAIARGCTNAHLDTYSFQARGFYEKLGYSVFGELKDFPPGHSKYFLQKRLAPEG